MRPNKPLTPRACLALLALALTATAPAQPAATDAPPDAAAAQELQQQLLDQMADINAQYRRLLQQVEAMDSRRRQLERSMLEVSDLSEYRAGTDTTGSVSTAGKAAATPVAVGDEQREELESQQNEIPEIPRVSDDVGGVLTPKGRLVIEPSVQFQNNSLARVNVRGVGLSGAVVIGDIDVRSVERETFVGALTARYGIFSRLEAEIKASWLTREDRTTARPITEQSNSDQLFSASGSGLGDIEFGLRYQFKKRNNWPYLIGNLRVKSKTGTDPWLIESREQRRSNTSDLTGELATGSGFWTVNPSLTFVYPTDPVAIFGNVGYLYTHEDNKGAFAIREFDNAPTKEFEGFGNVDPGDALRFNFGMGIGLNEASSISFSYALDLFSETEIAGRKIIGSDVTVGKFLVGYSFSLGDGPPLNLAVGIGTTDAAPDTDVTLRIPFNLLD